MNLSFKEIFQETIKNWKILVSTFIFLSIVSIFIALLLPQYYKSDALIRVNGSTNSSMQGLIDRFGSALPGMSSLMLRSGADSQNIRPLVIDTLKSKTFLNFFLSKYDFLPDIMAVKKYDQKSRTIIYDSDIYDSVQKKWTRKPSGRRLSKPSYIEAHKVLNTKIMDVSMDADNGFIRISIEHKSPEFALLFLSNYIKEADSFFRQKDLDDANSSLEFLNKKIPNLGFADIKKSASDLYKTNLNKKMIAEIKEYYLLEVIEEPFLPEKKSWPQRSLVVILITFIGTFLSWLFTIFKTPLLVFLSDLGNIQK